ncbi:MAG: hypothetical protein P1U40_12380 [Coxiellaceae bacterium]|nr:hypothetical protein [Coxiellaceae bacterium]
MMFDSLGDRYTAMKTAIAYAKIDEFEHCTAEAKADGNLARLKSYLMADNYALLTRALSVATDESNTASMSSIISRLLTEAKNCGVLTEMLSHGNFDPFWRAVSYNSPALALQMYQAVPDEQKVVMLSDDRFVNSINYIEGEDLDPQLLMQLYTWRPELFKQDNIDRVAPLHHESLLAVTRKVSSLRRSVYDMSRQLGIR